jgi:hypothetical protein
MNGLRVILTDENILNRISIVRNRKVMFDRDLAELYGVSTKALKQQVKRNIERFPEDFIFEISQKEFSGLRSQFVTSNRGGARYMPWVFTEQGVAMLSSVLGSRQAILVNIQIIRVFTRMRDLFDSQKEILQKLEQLGRKAEDNERDIALIFRYLKQLEELRNVEESFSGRTRIGFKS